MVKAMSEILRQVGKHQGLALNEKLAGNVTKENYFIGMECGLRMAYNIIRDNTAEQGEPKTQPITAERLK